MKKKFIGLGVIMLTLTVGSCNKEYDFDKIDDTAVIGQNLSIPIDGRDTVLISKIITVKDGDLIKIDENTGDYFLSIDAGSEKSQSINIPAIAAIKPSLPQTDEMLPYSQSEVKIEINCDIPINTSTDVEKIISNIFNISGKDQSYLRMTISLPNDAPTGLTLTLKKDSFQIVCPSWLVFNDAAQTDIFEIKNGKITLKNDAIITKDNPLEIKPIIKSIIVDGNKSKFQPGSDKGTLTLGDTFKITGNATVVAEGTGTSKFTIAPNFVFTPASAEIEAKPDLAFQIDPVKIDKTKLPELLVNDTTVLDLGGDFSLIAKVSNEFPKALEMNTGISSIFKGGLTTTMNSFKNPFTFSTTKQGEYTTVAQSEGMRNTDTKRSLFYQVPDTVKSKDLTMKLTSGSFDVTLGKTYNVKFLASFKAPLCLGKDLKINYNYKLDFEVDLGEGTTIHDATLNIKFHNKLPFDIGVKPVVVDKTGAVIEKIHVESDITLKAGSLAVPVDTDAQIFLTSEEGFSSFGGLKFDLLMKNGTDLPLNKDMGITFDNISLHTENGIFIKIKK